MILLPCGIFSHLKWVVLLPVYLYLSSLDVEMSFDEYCIPENREKQTPLRCTTLLSNRRPLFERYGERNSWLNRVMLLPSI